MTYLPQILIEEAGSSMEIFAWFKNSKFKNSIKVCSQVKGTVSVIASDPPCKDGNVRFTTVPWKALSDQV